MHLRLGAGAAAAALCAHAAYVHRERVARAPAGRFLTFSPGSQDAAVAAALQTGDVVLFARDCSLAAGAAGAACVARRARGGARGARAAWDGAGVVVLRAGEPWVLEGRAGGGAPRLRRYEARVLASRAREVLVRPLAAPLPRAAAAALAAHAAAVAEAPRGGGGGGGARGDDAGADNAAAFFDAAAAARALGEAAALALGGGASGAVAAVADAARAAGLAGAVADMGDLAPPAQPWAASGVRFGASVWVRDLR